ncbi:MAG: aldehyde dehydrogenase family protein, partial [Tistlia sp.]
MARYGRISPWIGGRFQPTAGATFETRDPARGELLAEVEIAEAATVEAAVEAAAAGFRLWSRMTGT